MRNKFKFHAGVQCDGHVHKIGVSKKGRFAILDHSNTPFRRWDDWCDLGGKPPDCIAVLCNALATIQADARQGIDRVAYEMDWYSRLNLRVTGSNSGRLREHITGCIEKRRVRRTKRERSAHK